MPRRQKPLPKEAVEIVPLEKIAALFAAAIQDIKTLAAVEIIATEKGEAVRVTGVGLSVRRSDQVSEQWLSLVRDLGRPDLFDILVVNAVPDKVTNQKAFKAEQKGLIIRSFLPE